MKNEHALRFLLLRQFNIIKEQLPNGDFERVANSLRVEMVGEDYKVSWTGSLGGQEKICAKDLFVFYKRGDINPEEKNINDSVVNPNDEEARRLTEEIFDRSFDFNVPPKYPRDAVDIVDMIADMVLLVLLFMIGELGLMSMAVIAPILYLQYIQQANIIVAFYLALVACTPWSIGLTVGVPVYVIMQFLDPSPYLRRWRVIISTFAFAVGLMAQVVFYHSPFYAGASFWAALLVAMILSSIRILFGCNHSAVRLMMPFIAAGLYAAGHQQSAIIVFIFTVINLLVHAGGFGLIPFLSKKRKTMVSS